MTGSGSGGVSMSSTTGTTTFGDGVGTDLALTTTSGATPAFGLVERRHVTVAAAGTANVSATGGPAVDVTGTSGASLSFDDVDSSNSANDGVNLDGLGATGTFSADANSSIAGAAGIAFDVNGGSGAVDYNGAIIERRGHDRGHHGPRWGRGELGRSDHRYGRCGCGAGERDQRQR